MKIPQLLLFLLCFPSAEPQGQNTSSNGTVLTAKPGRISFKSIAYTAYMVEGFSAVAGNLLIILAVTTTKALRRKELIVVAGLALSEFLFGFGYFTAAIRRAWLEHTGSTNHPSTPWHCMWVIHTPFFITGASFQSFMLVVMSLDRLLAIKAALWYWKQRNKYAYICLGLAGGFTSVVMLGGVVGAYLKPSNSAVTLTCNLSMALPYWMGAVINLVQALGGWASVLLYILVVYLYREQGKILPNEQLQQEHMERERRMTKTIGICVFITVCTVCLGRTVNTILNSLRGTLIDQQTFFYIASSMTVLVNINMLANVFVYSYCQKEIRAAIVRILTCGRVKLSVGNPAKPQAMRMQRNIRVAPA